MRLATIADVEAAMAKPPTPAPQCMPAAEWRELQARMERRRQRERHVEQRRIDAAEMARVVADGIRLLNTPMMGERGIPEDDVLERARNVTQAILGLWDVRRWP